LFELRKFTLFKKLLLPIVGLIVCVGVSTDCCDVVGVCDVTSGNCGGVDVNCVAVVVAVVVSVVVVRFRVVLDFFVEVFRVVRVFRF
jgi:hypothetical protein